MRPRITRSLLLVFVLVGMAFSILSATESLAASPDLTDAEAKGFIDTLWSKSAVKIKLGPLDIGDDTFGDPTNLERGIISQRLYRTYQAYEKVGLIQMGEDQGFKRHMEGKGFNWGTFLQQSQGLRGKIVVEPSARGHEVARNGGLPQKQGWLVIRDATFRVDRIIKNEPYRKGADDYRVIMATYTARWTPAYKRAMELLGNVYSEERKAKVLLKYDPFKSSWTAVAVDVANRDAEFQTDRVSRVLSNP